MAKYNDLEDDSPMPYGAHANTIMQEVPATYLLWMWNDGIRNAQQEDSKRGTVARYIEKNLDALKQECPDTIVED